jgi:gamma-glutamyl-gamma-aminobutyrate hydrolase PuuD
MRGIMLTGGMQQKGLTYERSSSKNAAAAAAQRDEMAATKMIGRN